MLGEELEDRTISRDYFTAIFNRSFNMIFVFDEQQNIIDANTSALQILGHSSIDQLKEKKNKIDPVFEFYYQGQKEDFFNFISKKSDTEIYNFENKITTQQSTIPVSCVCTYIKPINQFALVVKDISAEKEQEQKIINTIITTQEKEQQRISKELHDSVTQNLSGAKMLLSQLKKIEDSTTRNNLADELTIILNESIREARDMSHNIMPPYLRYGLSESITNLVERLNSYSSFKTNLKLSVNKKPIDHSLKASIYRIIQEFANNTTKYAEAKNLTISIQEKNNKLEIALKDDGIGFTVNHESLTKGIGWSNIISRIKAFSDDYYISSQPNQGTELLFTISL
jgi:two-component system NarL family sensor kinase